jgi:hypothetical protein
MTGPSRQRTEHSIARNVLTSLQQTLILQQTRQPQHSEATTSASQNLTPRPELR